jgi:hypothetical protein
LQSKVSGLYLDVQGGGLKSKTPVWQHSFNGTASQKWRIKTVRKKKSKKQEHEDWQYDCG